MTVVRWWRLPRAGSGGWLSQDGRWTVRGPIMGKPMFWLYVDGRRYTPSGRYEDAVSFKSAAAAKRFVVDLVNPEKRS